MKRKKWIDCTVKSVIKTIVIDSITKLFDCFPLLHSAKMAVTKAETTKMKMKVR